MYADIFKRDINSRTKIFIHCFHIVIPLLPIYLSNWITPYVPKKIGLAILNFIKTVHNLPSEDIGDFLEVLLRKRIVFLGTGSESRGTVLFLHILWSKRLYLIIDFTIIYQRSY